MRNRRPEFSNCVWKIPMWILSSSCCWTLLELAGDWTEWKVCLEAANQIKNVKRWSQWVHNSKLTPTKSMPINYQILQKSEQFQPWNLCPVTWPLHRLQYGRNTAWVTYRTIDYNAREVQRGKDIILSFLGLLGTFPHPHWRAQGREQRFRQSLIKYFSKERS